ncbi:GTPase-activating protein gyp8, variant 2 [Entomophthora muscae]|uniref:GTPase-activating protein gyp8, variant 2 n=1 Tax=Entomophthora muscae TaxID=34485 RepID=A0ACC2TPG1_9FUNG|nr:GTPase-activating protein gyp8, variant 2 [Entomophthora muscae]
MDPLESQGIVPISPKPESRHLSNAKASNLNNAALKRKSTSESSSIWETVITRPEILEIVEGVDSFTPADDLPDVLCSGAGYDIVANLEEQYKALETENKTNNGPDAAALSTESFLNLTPPTDSLALNSASPSYQKDHNHTSRSASISTKGLGVSTIASHPIYEVSDEEIQSLDILWPGPVLSSHSSPRTKTRTPTGSWAPNNTYKDPLVTNVDIELESRRTSSRFDVQHLPENSAFSISKPHISEAIALFIAEKSKEIILGIQNRDRVLLQKLGLGKLGFINSSLRSDAWCILLHSEKNHQKKSKVSTRPHDLQIDKECSKAFLRFPSTLKGEKRRRKQKELAELLKAIFQREPKLSYYQGFRDVAACFLLVLGKRKVANAIQNAALFYFRDMMLETLGPVMRELAFGFCLIEMEDPVLHSFLVASQVQSYYGLSEILTWFSYASNSLSATSRIFDALLSSDPIFSVYLLSAATLYSRNEILKLKCEKSEVHSFLSQIPLRDIEELISSACNLFKKYPPASIEKTSKINIGKM